MLSGFLQDLCDHLWDICDVRKDEWEVERNRIMAEKWVEDHLGLLTNTYISLMQVSLSVQSGMNWMCVTH